jgi:thioredoxin 1
MRPLEKITAGTFRREVLQAEEPVLVEFMTSTCPACRAFRPVLECLADEFAGRARVVEANVEEEEELGQGFRISAVPTLVLFRGGRIEDEWRGAPPVKDLRRELEGLTGSCAPRG